MAELVDTIKDLIAGQYEATLCTLSTCIDRCPETAWNAPVANHAFCQAVFHTLFFADLYLGRDEASLRRQPFHRDNQKFFGEYEELEDRKPQALYDRKQIKVYLQHCRTNASEVTAAETADTLAARSTFPWLTCSRAEVHLYNIRHIQHHAAQLILRLRLDNNEDIPWVRSGWREV